MSELKPCPFCGGEAKIRHRAFETTSIQCERCGVETLLYEDSPSSSGKSKAKAAWNRRAQPANEPLTLEEMNALDHEPIYILHTGGKWTMNGWHIATASSYQNHGRCDLEIDNGNTTIDMQNYGKTWLAYDHKPGGEQP